MPDNGALRVSPELRRAQEAAEAARPFAERMTAVMTALAAGVGTGDGAPKLLAGNGKDQVHLLVVMTSERGLCGGFNSSIAKLAREHVLQGRQRLLSTLDAPMERPATPKERRRA